MATAADKKRWDKLHADMAAAEKAKSDLEIELRVKYGSEVVRPSNRHWMSKSERTKLEKLEARVDKIHTQIYEMVEKLSPRDWNRGVPGYWVTRDLTWEDMIRPANEPLSVVVPGAYGYPDGYMKEESTVMSSEHLVPFESWQDVLTYARSGQPLYYQAPMDHRPVRLNPASGGSGTPYTYRAQANSIRIWPPGSIGRGRGRTSDPFTADSGHLDRFSHPAEIEIPGKHGALQLHRQAQQLFFRTRDQLGKHDAFTVSGMDAQITVLRDAIRQMKHYADANATGAKEWLRSLEEWLDRAEARRASLRAGHDSYNTRPHARMREGTGRFDGGTPQDLHDFIEKGIVLKPDRVEGSVDLSDDDPVYVAIVMNVTGYGPHLAAVYVDQNRFHATADTALQSAHEILENWELEHNQEYFEELEREHGDDAMSVFTETFDARTWKMTAQEFANAVAGTYAESFFEISEDFDDIQSALETAVQDLVDESAAQGWSNIGDQDMMDLEAEGYDDQSAWSIAAFGNAIAVNGETTFGPDLARTIGVENERGIFIWSDVGTRELERWLKSEGYEITDRGGDVPSVEGYATGRFAIERVAHDLGEPIERVERAAKALDWWPADRGWGDVEIPGSTDGDVTVWAKPLEREEEDEEIEERPARSRRRQ